MEKRDGLLRLLKDCEDGKIDRVITKSISRFSRNTTDCLEMVRSLSRLGIYLYFEKENIDTEHMSSELMLSILSSIAESESRSISENTKWSIKHRYEAGTFIIAYPPYGYENVDGKMVIVPEEAEVVKEIFQRTISGQGSYVIAKWLNEAGIPSKRGNVWHSSTVKGILKNEKYTGDVIFQKTYTDDNFNRHTNYGERNMYLCKNHHEPIISHEVFEMTAEVMAQRGKEKGIEVGDAKYLNRYALSGKIICGECGATFKRRTHYKPSGDYIAWTCCSHIKDKTSCSMLYIKDEDVKRALVRMMRKLKACHEQILKPFVAGLKGTNNKERLHQVLELESQIEKNLEQQNIMVNLMSAGYIEPELYHAERSALFMEADRLAKEKDFISKGINGDLTHLEEAQKLLRYMAKKNNAIDYDDALMQDYVECIIVQSRDEVCFELKCGLKLTEKVGVNMMHTPYGYKIENGQAVIDEPLAKKVRQLFVEFLNCGSMRAAAVKVGIEKTHSVIGRLLRNEVYLGDEYYPQLIDEELFNKVQELRNSNARFQNRIRDYIKQAPVAENIQYRIEKVQQRYENPYQQAEYAYGLIEEEKYE